MSSRHGKRSPRFVRTGEPLSNHRLLSNEAHTRPVSDRMIIRRPRPRLHANAAVAAQIRQNRTRGDRRSATADAPPPHPRDVRWSDTAVPGADDGTKTARLSAQRLMWEHLGHVLGPSERATGAGAQSLGTALSFLAVIGVRSAALSARPAPVLLDQANSVGVGGARTWTTPWCARGTLCSGPGGPLHPHRGPAFHIRSSSRSLRTRPRPGAAPGGPEGLGSR